MAADSDAEEVVQVTASATRPGARTHHGTSPRERKGSRDEEDHERGSSALLLPVRALLAFCMRIG